MMRCSIILPVQNRASLTRQCLHAILDYPPEDAEIEVIVVDDGSQDATPAVLTAFGARIRRITHSAATGFAAACNDGAAAATGTHLVFLHHDVIPLVGWLDTLVRFAAAHPDAAVVGSKLLFPDDTVQHAGIVIGQDGEAHHMYAGWPSDHPAVNVSRRFQAVTAACALVRRDAFDAVGGFDPAFRGGMGDVDLCLRMGERGEAVQYCHESVLYHLDSRPASSGAMDDTDAQDARLYRSRWAYRVRPDDVQYYLDDGVLAFAYEETYPLRVRLSPLLAVADDADDAIADETDRLLARRAAQVRALLRENIRLKLRMQEGELAGDEAIPPAAFWSIDG